MIGIMEVRFALRTQDCGQLANRSVKRRADHPSTSTER
jgi:hypothetical protein